MKRHTTEGIRIELVEPEQFDAFSVLHTEAWGTPAVKSRQHLVAMNEHDRIVGFVGVESVVHVAPLYVTPEYRGSGVAEMLAEGVVSGVEPKTILCMFTTSRHMEKIAEKFQMREARGKLYFVEVINDVK